MSSILRMTGLATGLDTEEMIQKLMQVENMKVDKVKQDRQILLWQQEMYREILEDINTFKSTYFDILKPESYALSANNYSAFDIESEKPSIITATGGAGAVSGVYKVKDINLATKASVTGGAVTVKQAQNPVQFSASIEMGVNNNLSINVGGADYNISLDVKSYNSVSDIVSHINSKLSNIKDPEGKTLSSKVLASLSSDGMRIEFTPVQKIDKDNNTLKLAIDGEEYDISLYSGDYTLKSLAESINKSLTSAKDSNGKNQNIVDKVKAVVSSDGTKIEFVGLNGSSVNVNDTGGNTAYNIPMTLRINGALDADNSMDFGIAIDSTNDTFNVVLGGDTYQVKLDHTVEGSPYKTLNELIDAINNAIQNNATRIKGDGTGPDIKTALTARLSLDGSKIQFVNNTGTEENPPLQMSISGAASKTLGFASSINDIYPTVKDKISSLITADNSDNGVVIFTINDVEFKYNFLTSDKDKSISDILNDISQKAGVEVSYNELGRKFTISSKSTGSDQKLTVSSSAFLNSIFGTGMDNPTSTYTGSNATATITDPKGNTATVTKTTNTFTIDGVTYNLMQNSGIYTDYAEDDGEIKITLTANVNKTFDKIKALVDKYNEIVEKINSEIREKKEYSYKPLTDAQKKEMNEDEIKAWEEKAKQGILRNDDYLQKMLYALRSAFFDGVAGAGITAADIGLSTDKDYTKGGKITIDETKLKNAILNNPEQVKNLFMQDSDIDYDVDHIKDKDRYGQIGIFRRINDILTDYTRTTRNSKGQKGLLIEKAGVKGDLSEINSILSKQIENYDKRIKELNTKLIQKENRYYAQFARLEKAIQRMNEQSNWLYMQMGFMTGGR